MTTYITVADPSALTPIAFTMDDVPKLGRGQEANIGTDMSAPRQLNCRYDGGLTYVQPIGGDVMPWKFEGYVSPEDCRAWYRSSVEPKAEPAVE
jgi:hypothetical protein